jgi:inorganic pyrophosphatase
LSRIYKIPDGKPENTFAFSGEAKNKKYATEIIHECHEAWRRLITGETPAKAHTYDLSMYVFLQLPLYNTGSHSFRSRNITIKNSPGFVRRDDPSYTNIPTDSRKPAGPIDPSGKEYAFS